MKTTKEIIGLSVFGIKDVNDIGSVKDLVINPDKGTVDFLLVEPKNIFIEKTVIKYEDVVGVGEDAVTVEDKDKVFDTLSVPELKTLLGKDTKVIGCKVMTDKGTFVGKIIELAINEHTGKIIGCQWLPLDNEDPSGYIPASCVITFGKDIIVVDKDFEQHIVDIAELSDEEYSVSKSVITSTDEQNKQVSEKNLVEGENIDSEGLGNIGIDGINAENIDIDMQIEENSAEIDEDSGEIRNGDPLEFFENKQDEYLIGRKVNVTIIADNGEVIANEGDIVTPEIVERARANDKYVDLTLNTIDE